ncbi:TPA: type-F conjugative transfer system pilin assembly protein TraF [Yersinia enterocolitica]
MRRSLLVLVLFCLTSPSMQAAMPTESMTATKTYIDDPIVGWHWYNEPQSEDDEEEEEKAPDIPLSQLPPNVQMRLLQKMTETQLNTAILHPSAENVGKFLRLQQFWTNQASAFRQGGKKALLESPDLDYNLQYSHYNSTVPAQLAADKAKQVDAIRSLTQQYGVFFFYRGSEPLDNLLATVVRDFASAQGVAIIPISMDGARSPAFPASRIDSGQAQNMGVSHFPALFLVNPTTQEFKPLAYGFMTQDDLSKQFLNVATDFAPVS